MTRQRIGRPAVGNLLLWIFKIVMTLLLDRIDIVKSVIYCPGEDYMIRDV